MSPEDADQVPMEGLRIQSSNKVDKNGENSYREKSKSGIRVGEAVGDIEQVESEKVKSGVRVGDSIGEDHLYNFEDKKKKKDGKCSLL